MPIKNNITETATYLQSLQEAVNFDDPAIEKAETVGQQSLPVKVLSIFGGVLSAVAFFGFLVVAGLYDSKQALLYCGAAAIVAGLLIGRRTKLIIWDTISITTFIIGCLMLGVGITSYNLPEQQISLIYAGLAILCLTFTRNYILSFVATLILTGSILTYLLAFDRHDLVYVYVALLGLLLTAFFQYEVKLTYRHFKTGFQYGALRTGLLFSFLIGLTWLTQKFVPVHDTYLIWSTSIISILAVLYMTTQIMSIFQISRLTTRFAICLLIVLLLSPTLPAPGIAGSILLLLLTFRINYRTGFVIAVLALLYFLGQYYYDLSFTLLTKSILLMSSGLLFILFYLFTTKRTRHEKI